MATILQSHHAIEAHEFNNHRLLKALVRNGLINPDASNNRLYLPYEKDFADQIDAAPHRGKTDGSYTEWVRNELNRITRKIGGKHSLHDIEALKRAVPLVQELQDTLKVGMIHREIFPSIPDNMSRDDAKLKNFQSLSDLKQVRADHPDTLKSLRSMTAVESEWAAITHSERSVMDLVEKVHNGPMLVVRAKGEPPVRDVAGRMEFHLAVSDAQASGHLALSESNAARIQQVLVDDLPGIGPLSKHGVYDLTGLPRASYRPLSQGGFATIEALIGEVPQHTLLRAAGPLATGVDLTLSLRRAAELDAQDNPRAAQSELERFAARNVGGWAAGTTAYIAGAPAAVIASTAASGAIVLEKAVEWKDNKEITNQQLQNVDWEFNGRSWSREAQLDKPRDGIEQPVEGRVHASYAQARVLNHKANSRAAEIALGKAPTPQDPFDLPASDRDRIGANNPNWRRNPQTEDWERQVNVGTSRDPIIQHQTASPERAAELNQQAVARILENIATGRESIAALYQEHHLAQRANDLGELPPAVLAALPKPDTVTSFNGQTYQRSAEGVWSNGTEVAQGNLAAELELTRAVRQPFLEEHQQRVAQLQAQPPLTPEQQQQDALVYRYRLSGIELEPDAPEAIALATQRTRDAQGLTGPAVLQLQPQAAQVQHDATGQIIKGSTAAALRPIDHYQLGADGAYRVMATTSSEDIQLALQDVQARKQQTPVPDTPELRIAQATPQQREAQEQATREANRQGLSQSEVTQVATLAAVQVSAKRPDATAADAVDAVVEKPAPAQMPPMPDQAATAAQAERAAQQAQMLRQTPRSSEPQSPEPQPPTAAVSPTLNAPSQATTATPTPTEPSEINGLRLGDSGNDVAFLQHRLKQAGATGTLGQPVPQDGQFGADTDHAVRQVQQAQGLPATGVADATFDNALTLQQNAQTPLSATFGAQVQARQEQERQAQEQQAREALERQQQEQREREAQEREARQSQQQAEREQLAQQQREAQAREAAERAEPSSSSPDAAQRNPGEPGAPPERNDLRLGDQGTDVAFLQYRLHKAGMTGADDQPVPQDGTFGPDTDAAVRQFQQANGLPATGVADQAVNNALVEQERVQAARSQPAATAEAMPAPSTPQQTIQSLSPAQQQAQTQAISEAQRQGASQAEVQQVATAATASVGKAPAQTEPEEAIVSAAVDRSSLYTGPGMGGPSAGRKRDERGQDLEAPVAEKQQAQTFPTDHRDYALFAAIQAGLPKGTPDEKTAELLYATKVGGLDGKIIKFDRVSLDGDKAYVYSPTPGKGNATGLSLSAPAPPLEETLRKTQDFNQADDLRWELFHQEQAEIERQHQLNPGPVMKMTLNGPGEGNADGGDGGGGE